MMARRRTFSPPGAIYSIADAWEGIRNDYAAAKSSRFRRRRAGISASGSGGDYHYRNEGDWLRMMEYARDFARNDIIIGPLLDRCVDNVVQGGFRVEARTGDAGLDVDLAARWAAWGNDPARCDVSGESTFHEIERLAFRSMLVDGDVFVLPRLDGGLQPIEAHRVRTPKNTTRNVVHGVLLDKATRKRLQYWITKEDVSPADSVTKVADVETIPARDEQGRLQVYHVYNPKRFSQTRGVTAFHPIFDHLGMFEDVQFARLVQAQIVACFAILRMRDIDVTTALSDTPHGAQETETRSDGTMRTIEGVAPGMEVTGEPGERLEGFSPNVPNPEFFPHVKLILQMLGANLGVPLILLLLDASETNFSGWRGALDQAKLGFQRNQRSLVARLHTPTYQWKLRQWRAADPGLARMSAKLGDEAFFGHDWHLPVWPYIEPWKDANADALRLDKNLISPRRVQAERGREWDIVAGEIIADKAMLVRLALAEAEAINGEFPDAEVGWRELANMVGAAPPRQEPEPMVEETSANAGGTAT